MDYIDVKAKNVDDAITEALIQLSITSDMLDYEVIDKGSSGFLGIGARQAIIRARRKQEEVKEEIEPEVVKEVKDVKKEVKKEPKKEIKKEVKAETKQERKPEPKKESKKEFKREERTHEKNHDKPKKEKKQFVEKEKTEHVVIEKETIDVVESFLKDVMSTMDLEVEIVSTIDEEGILNVELRGNEMGILIGKRGQTLDSLQYLTSRVANKAQDGYIRVKLDTENYRARRKATLENLARNIAHKVKKTRRPVSLEPMNPYERRIIHSALQNDRYVSTHSEGEEPYRRVVITLNRK